MEEIHFAIGRSAYLFQGSGNGPHPLLIGWHGGGWQAGAPNRLFRLAQWLADRGYAVLLPDYTLARPAEPSIVAAIEDAFAALDWVRQSAASRELDTSRIALMGESSGAQLAAMAALRVDAPLKVKALIGVYGIYDLLAQWNHDQLHRPLDSITQTYVGHPPMVDRMPFILNSPVSWTTVRPAPAATLLVWGERDDVVDYQTQSQPFLLALKQARFPVRNLVVPAAGHFWLSDDPEDSSSPLSTVAPALVRFLKELL